MGPPAVPIDDSDIAVSDVGLRPTAHTEPCTATAQKVWDASNCAHSTGPGNFELHEPGPYVMACFTAGVNRLANSCWSGCFIVRRHEYAGCKQEQHTQSTPTCKQQSYRIFRCTTSRYQWEGHMCSMQLINPAVLVLRNTLHCLQVAICNVVDSILMQVLTEVETNSLNGQVTLQPHRNAATSSLPHVRLCSYPVASTSASSTYCECVFVVCIDD